MGRSELREHIFRLLFCMEFHTQEELEEQTKLYLGQLENTQEKDMEYIHDKFLAVAGKKDELDGILNEYSTGWKTGRMNKTDLSILRLAVYEIKFDGDIPQGVAINEAVELAKRYSSEDAPSFVNGILGKIVK